MTRIITALAARRDQLHEDEKGFTLIELLVVVIIIGILAAIAIPVYVGVQNNAKDSGVQSDVANMKIAVVSLQTSGGSLPASFTAAVTTLPTTVDWKGAGATIGQNNNGLFYKANTTAGTFCVSAISSTGTVFYATDTLGAAKSTATTAVAACP